MASSTHWVILGLCWDYDRYPLGNVEVSHRCEGALGKGPGFVFCRTQACQYQRQFMMDPNRQCASAGEAC